MKNGSSCFDNLDELSGSEPETVPGADTPGMAQRRQKMEQKQEQEFTIVPDVWFDVLTETKRRSTWPVAWRLLKLAWKNDSLTVTLSNLGLKSVSRSEKSRALKELESAGLVTIERTTRSCPRITLLKFKLRRKIQA